MYTRIKVIVKRDAPYSEYGKYSRGDIGWIDGYTNGLAVVVFDDGSFGKVDLGWLECINKRDTIWIDKEEKDENTET